MTSAIPFKQDLSIKPLVTAFFDKDTNTFSYVVQDPSSKSCAIVDSVTDIDYPSGSVSHEGADAIIQYVKDHDLSVEWLLETHVHADHLSAATYLKEHVGGDIGIGEKIKVVQKLFGKIFNAGPEFKRDGSQFDRLFSDGDSYKIGNMTGYAMATPGHTPACMTYVIGNAAFVGDTIFMPDGGTARADFPGGNAQTLYRSIKRLLSLTPDTLLHMCHDYCPGERPPEYVTTVAKEKQHNIHVNDSIDEAQFVKMREERDVTLGMPRLILPSLQVNMRAGHLPPPEDNDKIYLKIPVNAFK